MKHGRVWLGFNLTAICAVTMMLAGCSTPSIFHKYKIHDDEATSILIDAKQRAILSVHSPQLAMLEENSSQDKPEGTDLSGQQGQPEKNRSEKDEQSIRFRRVMVCAEPSPDALSVVSSSLNAYGSGLNWLFGGKIGIEELFQEGGRNLFTRNATIQLLRDGLYRQCEAYLNGVINKKEYKDLADRYIDGMVALLAIERITPDPADDAASDSKTECVSTETQGQSPSHAEPPSKKAIEAVEEITRAFLAKNHVDECISLLSEPKLANADKKTAINMCLFIAISDLSKEDRGFLLSRASDLVNALEKNSNLNKETTTTLGTANVNLGKATDALGQTNKALGTTNENLTKTTGDLSNTNETLGETNAALNETNKNLTATNETLGKTAKVLDETKKKLTTTNENLVKTTGDLSNTNARLDKTNAALSETKNELANTLTTTNAHLGKATTALGETNKKLEKVGESLSKSDNQDDVNAEPLNGNEAKTSQETNGQVSDEEETADQKSQQ